MRKNHVRNSAWHDGRSIIKYAYQDLRPHFQEANDHNPKFSRTIHLSFCDFSLWQTFFWFLFRYTLRSNFTMNVTPPYRPYSHHPGPLQPCLFAKAPSKPPKKPSDTFHYTSWLIGILIMVYYSLLLLFGLVSPYNCLGCHPLLTLNNAGDLFFIVPSVFCQKKSASLKRTVFGGWDFSRCPNGRELWWWQPIWNAKKHVYILILCINIIYHVNINICINKKNISGTWKSRDGS